jgi:hypothetical protein
VNPVSFLLNRGDQESQVVGAPAYSLTKVLTSAAVIVGPIATLLVDKLSKVNFSPGQIVALAIGLLGFLAIAAAADVLSRSYAAAAKERSAATAAGLKAEQAAQGRLVPFPHPVSGRRITREEDRDVKVLASAYGDQPYFLVDEGAGQLTWLPASHVTFGEREAVSA